MDQVSTAFGATTAPPASAAGKTEISSDFETFLKMLTVQMENQDPLNPIESSDYAVQLATFSGVEQQVQTNDLLRDLAAQMGAGGMAQMAGWVGMEARTSAAARFDSAPIELQINPAGTADLVELVVTDDRGIEVQRMQLDRTATEVSWAGVASDGSPFQPGLYQFEVVSTLSGQEVGRSKATHYDRVTEVRADGGNAQLVMSSGAIVPVTDVTAVREPAT